MPNFWPRVWVCVCFGVAVGALCSPLAGAEACPNTRVRTGLSTVLPDCRAYELASPADKNGGDVIADSMRTRAAATGDAVQFSAGMGFGDAQGTSISSDYLTQRTGAPGTTGWSTHAITPGDPTTLFVQFRNTGIDSVYVGELASDLGQGVLFSFRSLTAGSPNTASDSFLKLYRRGDLLSAGPGSYQLVTGCPGCSAPMNASPDNQPALAGASSDFSHVIFESTLDLTVDAAGLDPTLPKLYEWIDGPGGGTVSLVGQVPASGTQCCDGGGGSAPCVVAPNSQAGGGALVQAPATVPKHYTLGAISSNGTRIYFTVRSTPDTDTGALYLRTGNGTGSACTVQVNVAEPVPTPTSQDAFFAMATPDGSKVFFTTKENLTADDTSDPNLTDLYMYNANAPAEHHLTLISKSDAAMSADVQGMVGASDDGHYVYFDSNQQLLSGQPPTGGVDRIFVWHDGVIREVGAVAIDDVRTLAFTESTKWRGNPKASRVSPDGTDLLFVSKNSGEGAPDDLSHSGVGDACPAAGGCEEVYSYDATSGGPPVCVSCHTPDGPAQTDASIAGAFYGGGAHGFASHLNHPLSDDGRFVSFTTGDRLVGRDLDGSASDVYEYDTVAGQLHLISSGKAGSLGSFFLDASTNGHDVFFATHDRLNGWDVDNQIDLYDARVDGGLPDPAPPPLPCTGDACQGSLHAPVVFAARGSNTFIGGGNVPPGRHRAVRHRASRHRLVCRRGTVRRRVHGRVRCVKIVHRHAGKPARGRKKGGR